MEGVGDKVFTRETTNQTRPTLGFRFPYKFQRSHKRLERNLVGWLETCEGTPTRHVFRISYSRACQVFIVSSPCYSRKRHRSSWPFGRTGLGSGAHPQPRLPWRWGRRATRSGAALTPSPQPCFLGSPGDWEAEPRGWGPLSPHLCSPAPLCVPPPISSALLPSASPQPTLLTSRAGESGELGDMPPRGRTRLLQSQPLPPGKQIPERNGTTRKSQVWHWTPPPVSGNLLNLSEPWKC